MSQPSPSEQMPGTRRQAMQSLLDIWLQQPAADWHSAEIEVLLEASRDLCFWPLILDIANRCPVALAAVDLLAEAAVQMGDLPRARSFIRQGLLLQPRRDSLVCLRRELEAWAEFCASHPDFAQYQLDDNRFYLQLLGHQHLDSFMALYDPETAERCCMPEFVDARDWHHWLDDQYADGDQLTFAIMHPDWGMIGSVSLIMHGREGFFYYWVGADFRGQGYGPAAARLLLSLARQFWGLDNCYAKVYEDNLSSRRGLQKMGFIELPIRAAPPYDNEVFCCLSAVSDLDRATDAMYWFYDRIRSWRPFTRPVVATARTGA